MYHPIRPPLFTRNAPAYELHVMSLFNWKHWSLKLCREILVSSCDFRLKTCWCSGMATSQIASSVFAVGTTAVLPFYTLMVVAPKAEIVSPFLCCSLTTSFAELKRFIWNWLFFSRKKLNICVSFRFTKKSVSLLCRPRSVWRVAYRMSS